MKHKRFGLIILTIFLSLEVLSCATERRMIIDSFPNDNSWFTRAKRIALTYGEKDDVVLGYHWSSKTIYINQEKVYYSIFYTSSKWMKVPWPNMVTLNKKYGSLTRSITFFEDWNVYNLQDSDFFKTIEIRKITKEEAEELAYNFFKELDRYGLL